MIEPDKGMEQSGMADSLAFNGTYEDFLRPRVLGVGNQSPVFAELRACIDATNGLLVYESEPNRLVDAVDRCFPSMVVLALSGSDDWNLAIRRCKARPESRQISIYVFSEDEALLQLAMQSGADYAWQSAVLQTRLEEIVSRHVDPPIVLLAGWDDSLPALAQQGVMLFNQGEYFEQHELFEEAWLAEKRPIRVMYQGILQIGVALLQIERENRAGAIKMLRRGLPKLQTLPERCQGIEIGRFRTQAERLHAQLCALGGDAIPTVSRRWFPKIVVK